ncbi:GNAT family N-acetyltransferase [Blautia sp. XA-2221]|uniref:GNAT family N-acetyltransferase n=1 Tax=Blautia sp. XA-2221 TaxID=2903961 RepID=UPI0023798564|nr:N-acetyltransferase [Blautia sp. XA-2221]
MDYLIREMKKEEYCLLDDFLYEAIYIPEGMEPPDRSVINCPELQEYIAEFGKRQHDKALVAEVQRNVVGAVWVRVMNDYGHIDTDTPSLAVSVYREYRGQGIGTSLLNQLLAEEKAAGYSRISLSVQKNNYAVRMYQKAGFTVVDESPEEYIMRVDL